MNPCVKIITNFFAWCTLIFRNGKHSFYQMAEGNNINDNDKIKTSVRLQDTDTEGRPSIYLFIFVNPLSGARKGSDLIHLPIQHFRLRRLPQIQVEIHNYLDPKDRQAGIDRVNLIQNKIKDGDLPPIRSSSDTPTTSRAAERKHTDAAETMPEATGRISEGVQTRHIHVWSGGGDGTVMSIFEMLVENHVDLDLVFLSCIPFGTGNDFSQVLGWGRTEQGGVIGDNLESLEQLISDRFEYSEPARLDIWQAEMTSYDGGQVRLASEPKTTKRTRYVAKMCNYMSIGVQGYVGSGFEKHRSKKRWLNIGVYTIESSKWAFWRKFPTLNNFIDSIRAQDGQQMLLEVPSTFVTPTRVNPGSSSNGEDHQQQNHPKLATPAIDLIIQNIPHLWGQELDIWGEAKEGLETVSNRSGPTDPDLWTPQLANDGKLEVIAMENMMSYLKKLANFRDHVARVGQFPGPFEIHFREPPETATGAQPHENTGCLHMWQRRRRNKYERKNVLGVMVDGEFYRIRHPQRVRFERIAQVVTLGRSDQQKQGRLVRDEKKRQDGQMYQTGATEATEATGAIASSSS
ncbi:ATP-NAD kinase-like domain-containing protein [Zychaea mexicana]|uniref:ATP-NAD kinase-like domain-containing protein n=1 Tax=Zychaea mexicana TaxID=64656 RepID=UPI0022FEA475|nr:ATP-NAD kinase-like domain-containing protein [Zychaea mexicana]KAI9497077.1 ATP-NAD kinase-like domain-containing protein [Zychaea mexicana]